MLNLPGAPIYMDRLTPAEPLVYDRERLLHGTLPVNDLFEEHGIAPGDDQGPCFWHGHHHDLDPDHDDLFCLRCRRLLTYEQVGWPGLVEWLRAWWNAWRCSLRCRECGRWFGRHRAGCDGDVPF